VRVIFFGSDRFSCMVLEPVLGGPHRIVGVVTQPDKAAGRGLNLCPTEVCSRASELGVPVYKPDKLANNHVLRGQLRALRPDALLVASYRKMIPPSLLKLTAWPLNVHPSPLPLLRGASPIRSALLQGFTNTACCIMRMTPGLDDGDVLLRQEVAIDPLWDFGELRPRLGMLGGELAGAALTLIEHGQPQLHPQDHSAATYCREFTRADTLIDWRHSAAEVARFIRAWSPDIGALARMPDGEVRLWRASVEAETPMEQLSPGTIARVTRKALWVACGQGWLRIDELQPASRQRMSAASFLAGHHRISGQGMLLPTTGN
jgi:methionyl-tRNA formyltransferase